MAKRKMQKIAALIMSAAIVFTSAPDIVYADSGKAVVSDTTDNGSDNTGTDALTTGDAANNESDGNASEITGITVHTASGLVYNGKAQKLVEGIDGTQSGDTIEYSIDGGDCSSVTPEATNAGDYTVSIRIQRSGYQDFTDEVDVTINKADMSVTTTTHNYDYDGTEHFLMDAPTVKAGPSNVVFHYAVNDEAATTSLPKATEAGSYSIHITADGDANYNDYDAYVDTDINAVSLSGLSAELYGGTYDGSEHNAVNSIKLADGTNILAADSGYTVNYTMNGTDYGTTMPTVKDAGTYTIAISVSKDPDYSETDVASENLTPSDIVIGKAKPVLAWNSGIPDGNRVINDGTTLDLHAVYSNIAAGDDFDDITYTVVNDTDGDNTDVNSLATIDENGILTLKKAGCNLLVTASSNGDANHESAGSITYGLTVMENHAESLLHFESSKQTFFINTITNTASDQAAVKADDDNGTVTYSLVADSVSADDAGISIDPATGKVSVADVDKLSKSTVNAGGTLDFTVVADKTAGTKTATWSGWTDKERTVYDKAEASYTLEFSLNSALASSSFVKLTDASGKDLSSPNGNDGWYTSAVVVKPALSGYQIAKNDLVFSDSVTFGEDETEHGSDLSCGVYLKNLSTGEISTRILLSNVNKIDTSAPEIVSISISEPKQKKGTLWFFNRDDSKATVTVTGIDAESGIDHFEWTYEKSSDASDINESKLSGVANAAFQVDGSYKATFVLPDSAANELKNGQLRGTLSVTAVNEAGLRQGKTDDDRQIVVDSLSPTAEIEITSASDDTAVIAKDDVYYTTGDVTAVLKINEANFDADDVNVTLTKDNVAVSANGTWDTAGSNDTHQYTLPISGEGDYRLTVSYEDASGNRMSDASCDIHIDQTAPVVQVKYLNNDVRAKVADNGKTRNYFADTQTAQVTVTDHNFDPDKVIFDIFADGKEADPSLYTIGEWSSDDDAHTADITFSGDANYTFNVSASDLPGNDSAARDDDLFTVDKTAPTGTLKIAQSGSGFTAFVKKLIYKIFSTDSVKITGSAIDATSGIKSVDYYIYSPDKQGEFNGLTEDELKALDSSVWKPFSGSVSVNPDSAAFVYLRITDFAGNVSYINTAEGAIADRTAPKITVAVDQKDGAVSNTDVPFTVNAEDPVSGNTYSGLRSLTWRVVCNGVETQTGSAEDGMESGSRLQSKTASDTVSAAKNDSNNIIIEATATDWADNTATVSSNASIDVTSPKITLSYDNNDVHNEHYFNRARNLTVTVQERNFDEDNFVIPVTVDGVSYNLTMPELRSDAYKDEDIALVSDPVDSEKDKAKNEYTDDRTYTCVIRFGGSEDSDHDYAVSATETDTADNNSVSSFANGTKAGDSFTVDMVQPVIAVSYDNGFVPSADSSAPAYSREDVQPEFVITERNFAAKDASLSIGQKNYVGNALNVYSDKDRINKDENWTADENRHSFSPSVFTKDANYSLALTYTDLAGNTAMPYDAHYFTVDKTAPTGTLEIAGDNTIFNKLIQKLRYWVFGKASVSISGSSNDETSGIAKTEYLVYHPTPDENAKGAFDSTLTESALTQISGWKPFNGKIAIDPDDSGFVYLRITDRAGNISYINTADGVIAEKTAPSDITITLDKQPSRDGIYNTDVPFTVNVTDPKNGDTYSGLKEVSWTVLKDGTVTQSGTFNNGLSKGARIQSQTGSAVVDASKNNSNDIVIRVDAVDWSGNIASNTKELSIDTTKPEAILSYDNNDARNGKYFKADRNLTVTIKERNFNENDFSFPMVIDGEDKVVTFDDVRNGKYSLTMISDRTDSEAGTEGRKLTDDRMITYVIGFGKAADADHDYHVAMTGQDTAGNAAKVAFADGSAAPVDFTVDKVVPVIRVTAESGNKTLSPSADASNPAFTQNPVEITEQVDERNFDTRDAAYTVIQKNAAGKELSVYSLADIHNSGLWNRNGNANTFHLNTFSEDANYSVAFTYTDLAGNEAVVYTPHYFTVDKTAPAGSLTTDTKGSSETFTSFFDRLRYLFDDKNSIGVTGAANDDTAGIASVRYMIYDPGENARNTFSGLTISQLNSMTGWADWNGSINIEPDKAAFVYLRIEDRAGNISYINTADGIISDDTNPSNIQIELLGTPSPQGIYNGDVPFRVAASDPTNGGTYSGLRHVTWEVINNEKVTQSGNFDAQAGDISARTQTITGTGLISASQNNSNHVVLHVETEDWAGNTAVAEKELAIDITKPVIEITYDNNDPQNGKYFNNIRTATVRVIERNFDPSKVSIGLTSTGAVPQISGWNVSSQKGESDSAVNTATITFSADADYTLTASCTDMAGNRSDYGKVDTFTIDRTAPVISVAYDNNNASNEHYYKSGRKATVTVKEHNFNASAFTAAIRASYNGNNKTAPKISSFTRNGDINTATIQFADDGDYSFSLRDTDLAGNNATVYTQTEFTIDTVAPELSFFDIKNHSANKNTVAPSVRSTDLNFDPSAVTLKLKGVKHKEKIVKGTVSNTANGISIKLDDFAHDKETDDIYTLTAEIADKAGNVTRKSITFSVNRHGSTYSFSKKTARLLDKYYLKNGSKLVIYETNVDPVTSESVVVLKDGTSTTLVKGKDYTIKDVSEKNGWHKYKYVIKPECFKAEGLYEIQIRTDDKAGNEQDNKVKESPIRFVIDNTAPTIVITGIENNGRYKELSRTMHIQVTDNYAYGNVNLYVGDKKVKSFDADTVAKADGKLTYKLDSANGWQQVSVKYNDRAGNSGKPASMRVLITASTWQQILYSAWFIPVIIAVLCVAAFLIILVILKKRKNKNSDQ